MPKPSEIIRVARTLLGTPFHHQGRLKGVGVDCVGLIVCVCRELGVPHIDCLSYERHPDGVTLLAKLRENMIEVPVKDREPGNVITFRIGRFPRHVGIITDYGLIHTYQEVGRVVEHVLDNMWLTRISNVFRMKEAV